ncbi:MAG: membrane protein insertase YidC [Gemmatimonadota bacterium]
METKRVVLAVVLMVLLVFFTNLLFPPIAPRQPEGPAGAETDSTLLAVDSTPGLPEEPAGDRAGPEGPALAGAAEAESPGFPGATPAPEDTIVVFTGLSTLRFSTRGATLLDAELNRYLSYAPNGGGQKNVRLVRPLDRLFGFQVAVGEDTVALDRQLFTPSVPPGRLDVSGSGSRDSLTFRYEFPSGDVAFVVTYRFQADRYVVDVEGRLEGFGGRGYSVLTSLGHGLQTNEKNPDEDYHELAYVVNGRGAGIRSARLDELETGEVSTATGGPFHWVAVKNKYFLVAYVAPEGGAGFGGLIATGRPEPHATGLVASLPVPAGDAGFSFRAYLGPQEYSRLEAVGQDLESANPYGWRWLRPLIRPLVGLVMIILTWMHTTLSLAYGWVLILFGILMRVVLFPLYQKSMRSQMAQMHVQPLMKEIQTRHKDDPQRLQQEMIKLYKEHNVNPLAGCLPMMLPMPILFTLFFVFRGTIEFRGVPFLWLPDLSLKDPLYLIPLAMGLSMFFLQWIGQRGMEVNQQMRVMGYAMPVVFTFMFASLPSGLNLYYTMSNLASLPQQLYLARERKAMRKQTAPQP